MSRILLAWELGGSYGHISVLLPIARQLRQCGHTVVFAVKDCPASKLLDADGFEYVLSPRSAVGNSRSREPASFAYILAGAGFGDVAVLAGLVGSWHDLFNLYQPTVLVAQFAPVAQFAARLFGLPCLQINTGFESPPAVTPFPCFRPYLKLSKQQLLANELALLENINIIGSRMGAAPYSSLQEVMQSDRDLLVTLPELDHYQGRRNNRYIGPISLVDDGVTVQWPKGEGPRILVYLRAISGIASILETLIGKRACAIAVIPEIDDHLFAKFRDKGLYLSKEMVKLTVILPTMDLAITHAGHGTAAAAILAGVPMLVIPTTVEQWLVTRNIERLGVGVGIVKRRIADEFPQALERLLGDHSYTEKAQKLAKKYGGFDRHQTIQRLVKTIEGLPQWVAAKK